MVEVLERAQDINVEMKVGDAIADPLLRQRSSYREGRAMHFSMSFRKLLEAD